MYNEGATLEHGVRVEYNAPDDPALLLDFYVQIYCFVSYIRLLSNFYLLLCWGSRLFWDGSSFLSVFFLLIDLLELVQELDLFLVHFHNLIRLEFLLGLDLLLNVSV